MKKTKTLSEINTELDYTDPSGYSFNKAKHCHMLHGIPLHGTTTVLAVIAKPALINWAANMAVDYILEHVHAMNAGQTINWIEVCNAARKAHTRKKEASGDIGTIVHDGVEQWIKTGQEFVGDDQTTSMHHLFIEWAKENNVEFLESEVHVWSEALWVGGKFDFVFKKDGKVYIGDLKTGSGIYPEHFLQMAAYDLCRQEMGFDPADGYCVVNITKDQKIKVEFDHETKRHQEAFRHALALYKALKS